MYDEMPSDAKRHPDANTSTSAHADYESIDAGGPQYEAVQGRGNTGGRGITLYDTAPEAGTVVYSTSPDGAATYEAVPQPASDLYATVSRDGGVPGGGGRESVV